MGLFPALPVVLRLCWAHSSLSKELIYKCTYSYLKLSRHGNYLSTDEWIKMWYICTRGYHLVISEGQTFAVCNNMDGIGGRYAE